MSIEMTEEIKRWTAKRKSALVLDIIKGKTTVSEASRQYDLSPSEVEDWIDNATAGMENALKAKPDDVREQYERQIKDHSYGDNFNKALRNGRDGNKFHVAHCQVLERMMTQGRYKRYVATNKINGEFLIQGAQGQTDYAKLWVCQTCLKHLNYKGSRYSNKALQNAKNFNFKEFFSTYSSLFQHSPSYTAEDDVGYADNWADISKRVRENASYLCEKCTVDLNEHPDLCHVHHINGAKQDNSMHNLQVLCADCHRKEHLGHMHVSHSDMQRITTLRRRQNLLSSCSWDQALHLIDPALRDELELFKTEGYPAPHLGYQIIDPLSGKVHIECDAAWPAKREALTLTQAPAIPRWSIYCFGQKLGVQ